MLYIETSALLRMLVEGDTSLASLIGRAQRLITSQLTVIEADRGIRRAFADGRLSSRRHRDVRRQLTAFLESCEIIDFHPSVLAEAQRDFPVKPVRTLDALHLASLRFWVHSVGPVTMVSYDTRVRQNAEAWGCAVLPKT
jgi:hypothetical protein